jgi:hypothetical protein
MTQPRPWVRFSQSLFRLFRARNGLQFEMKSERLRPAPPRADIRVALRVKPTCPKISPVEVARAEILVPAPAQRRKFASLPRHLAARSVEAQCLSFYERRSDHWTKTHAAPVMELLL